MSIKHPLLLAAVLFWIALAIWPKLLFGDAMKKQNPTKTRIALLFLGLSNFMFWYILPK